MIAHCTPNKLLGNRLKFTAHSSGPLCATNPLCLLFPSSLCSLPPSFVSLFCPSSLCSLSPFSSSLSSLSFSPLPAHSDLLLRPRPLGDFGAGQSVPPHLAGRTGAIGRFLRRKTGRFLGCLVDTSIFFGPLKKSQWVLADLLNKTRGSIGRVDAPWNLTTWIRGSVRAAFPNMAETVPLVSLEQRQP